MAIAAPVAAWAAGAGASAASAAMVGAVVQGIVIGGVIGAATAAITGGDILKGALMGGLAGGLTGGITQGLSGGAAAAGEAVPDFASDFSGAAAPNSALPGSVGEMGFPTSGLVDTTTATGKGLLNTAGTVTASPGTPVIPGDGKGWLSKLWGGLSPEAQSGALQGAGKALGEVGKAIMTPDAIDVAEAEAKIAEEKVKSNKASTNFNKYTSKITLPSLWTGYDKLNTDTTVTV